MIPLFITADIETANDRDLNCHKKVLIKLNEDLNILNVPVTYFITADFALSNKTEVQQLNNGLNEIGCHGYNHKEDYRKLNYMETRNIIKKSLDVLEGISCNKITSFRSPAFTVSPVLYKVLIENGIKADFSICSGRMDFFYSKGGNIKWLFAPRNPYNPNEMDPFRKGNSNITIFPLTSMIFPLMSGTLYLAGLDYMKKMFKKVFKKAIRHNRPLVYMFHSYEFCNNLDRRNKYSFLHNFYLKNSDKRYKMNLEFIKYMTEEFYTKPVTTAKLL